MYPRRRVVRKGRGQLFDGAVDATPRRVKPGVQRVPVNYQPAAKGRVSFFPIHEEFEAGVVHIGQVLEIDVQLRVRRDQVHRVGQEG